jgi:CTD kinase subunit beta
MLECAGFDFRTRFPQKPLIKLAQHINLDKGIAKLAYNILLDLYKTFAPIKQTSSTMAFACVELATLITEQQQELVRGEGKPDYKKWGTDRGEIVETILDLLDLYTHFQRSTIVGPEHVIEKFIQIRLKFNQEVEGDPNFNRYTEWHDDPKPNGRLNVKTPKTPITPASPSDMRTNGRDGVSPTTLSPRSAGSSRKGIGARGPEGTVRFMIDVEQAKQEKETVAEYYKNEYEEYEVEVEEPIKPERDDRGGRNYYRNGRDDRSFHHHNKRRR